MSNITISGAYFAQVSITSANQNPAVPVLFEQSAYISYYGAAGVAAVVGDNSAAWRITNLGTVVGGGASGGGPGIKLIAGGDIQNGSSSDTTASISGYTYGVQVTGAAGTVTNSGTIVANNTLFGTAVYFGDGGVITNNASGVIQGFYGIQVLGGAATITNAGSVSGSFDAMLLHGDGTVTNTGSLYAQSFSGIVIEGTGRITNGSATDTTASITGGSTGVYIHTGDGTIINFGSITAPLGNAAYVYGGSVTNGSATDTTALISGGNVGVFTGFGGTAEINNFGSIYGGYLAGVNLQNDGSVTNGALSDSTAQISGLYQAIYAEGTAVSVVNHGTIMTTGTGQYDFFTGHHDVFGVHLENGGTVLNGGLGTIYGYGYGIEAKQGVASVTNHGSISGGEYGVFLGAGGTVTNSGTISGGLAAVAFGGSGGDRLVVHPGAVFSGGVTAAGSGNTLELTAGGAGTLSGLGSNYIGFDNVFVQGTAGWTITGAATVAVAVTLDDSGLEMTGLGLAGGTNFTLEHEGGPDHLTLDGLAGHSSFGNAISNVSYLDSIILPGVDLTGDHAVFDGVHTLTVEDAGNNPVFTFTNLTAAPGPALSFNVGSDFVQVAACYRSGTRILTTEGERAIETLRIGDAVPTLFGGVLEIKWIGYRGYDPRFIAGNPGVLPVLIRAGALAEGVPARDLYVSPKHAMHIDGVLVPAGALVNDVSILQPPADGPVNYVHVEFDSHDVILAEGAASESFVDCDSRGRFHNAADFARRYPDARPAPWRFCAERVEHGAVIETIRRRIDARAGLRPAEAGRSEQLGALRGHVEQADGGGVTGWAFNPEQPHSPVWLEIVGDGVVLARLPANQYRDDLRAAGLGRGSCGFSLRFDRPLRDAASLAVRRASDGAALALPGLVRAA